MEYHLWLILIVRFLVCEATLEKGNREQRLANCGLDAVGIGVAAQPIE